MKDANVQITRWYLALQVIHRPGNHMVVADFLSRSAKEGGSGLVASRIWA